jgi:hypothetical protein
LFTKNPCKHPIEDFLVYGLDILAAKITVQNLGVILDYVV